MSRRPRFTIFLLYYDFKNIEELEKFLSLIWGVWLEFLAAKGRPCPSWMSSGIIFLLSSNMVLEPMVQLVFIKDACSSTWRLCKHVFFGFDLELHTFLVAFNVCVRNNLGLKSGAIYLLGSDLALSITCLLHGGWIDSLVKYTCYVDLASGANVQGLFSKFVWDTIFIQYRLVRSDRSQILD